jgi:hypothetical protein
MLDGCKLITSNAGNGGSGSAGQLGQQERGYSGRDGGGCDGGNGGIGGNGGNGGGGAGGLSVGILYRGSAPARRSTVVDLGYAGFHGFGAIAGVHDGIDGVAQVERKVQ